MTKDETWNGTRHFPVGGWYFELLETVNPVDVIAYDKDGNVINSELQMAAGSGFDRRHTGVPFVRLEITTGASERVKFSYSDGTTFNRAVPSDVSSEPTRELGITSERGTHVQAKKTVTNASAELLAANATRRYLLIQNQDAAGIIYVSTEAAVATADAECIKIGPGEVYEPKCVPLSQLRAIGSIASNANVHVIEA